MVYIPRAYISKEMFDEAEKEYSLCVDRKVSAIVLAEYLHYLIRHQKIEHAFELCQSSLIDRQWQDGELVLLMKIYSQLILKTNRVELDSKVIEIAAGSREKDQIVDAVASELLKTYSTDYQSILPSLKQIVEAFQIADRVDRREWFIRFQLAVTTSAIKEKHLLVKEFAYLN